MTCHLRVWPVSTWCEVELGYGLRAAGFFFVRRTEFSVWWEGNIWGGMGLRYSNLARAGLLCLIFLTASLVVK